MLKPRAKHAEKKKYPDIEIVYAPEYCQFSVVQSDLRTLSKNQKILNDKLDEILKLLEDKD